MLTKKLQVTGMIAMSSSESASRWATQGTAAMMSDAVTAKRPTRAGYELMTRSKSGGERTRRKVMMTRNGVVWPDLGGSRLTDGE